MCVGCAIEFSASGSDGDEGDWESGDGSNGGIEDDDGGFETDDEDQLREHMLEIEGELLPVGRRRRRGRVLRRAAREAAATVGGMNRARTDSPGNDYQVGGRRPRYHRYGSADERLRGLIDVIADSDGMGDDDTINDEDDVSEGLSESEYGCSFIDDGDLSAVEVADETDLGSDEVGAAEGVLRSTSEVASEEDDPPIQELRQRRINRLAPAQAR